MKRLREILSVGALKCFPDSWGEMLIDELDNETGETAITYVLKQRRGHKELLISLLKAGANPDTPNSRGQLPLLIALMEGENFNTLMDAGASLTTILNIQEHPELTAKYPWITEKKLTFLDLIFQIGRQFHSVSHFKIGLEGRGMSSLPTDRPSSLFKTNFRFNPTFFSIDCPQITDDIILERAKLGFLPLEEGTEENSILIFSRMLRIFAEAIYLKERSFVRNNMPKDIQYTSNPISEGTSKKMRVVFQSQTMRSMGECIESLDRVAKYSCIPHTSSFWKDLLDMGCIAYSYRRKVVLGHRFGTEGLKSIQKHKTIIEELTHRLEQALNKLELLGIEFNSAQRITARGYLTQYSQTQSAVNKNLNANKRKSNKCIT